MINTLLVERLYLFHLTGSVVVGRHAAAFLSDLHGSGLQETVPDRPFGHVASAIAPDLYLDTKRTNQLPVVQSQVKSEQLEAGKYVSSLAHWSLI